MVYIRKNKPAPLGQARPAQRYTFPDVLAIILLINGGLHTLYHLTAIDPILNLNYVFSSAVIIVLFGYIVVYWCLSVYLSVLLLFSTFGLLCTAVVNYDHLDTSTILKYICVYAFYMAGYTSSTRRMPKRNYLVALAVFPLVVVAFGGSRVYSATIPAFSYFPNANTAVLFYTAIVFAAVPYLGRYSIWTQFLNVIAFRKIGVTVATVVSAVGWNLFPITRKSLPRLFLLAACIVVGGFWGLYDRTYDAVSNMFDQISSVGLGGIDTLSYGELAIRTGSTDLSGFFRIKHWFNILQIYGAGDLLSVLFGYGPGQTVYLTDAGLVPHNDYLLVLAEFGLVNFLCFVSLVGYALFGIGNKNARTMFTVLLIYFFSENLIGTYAAMGLFFGGGGLLHPRVRVRNAHGVPKGVGHSDVSPIQMVHLDTEDSRRG